MAYSFSVQNVSLSKRRADQLVEGELVICDLTATLRHTHHYPTGQMDQPQALQVAGGRRSHSELGVEQGFEPGLT